MEDEDTTHNVYALFPGIDTTPFGGTSRVEPESGDEGWSAVPQRTISTTDQPLVETPADSSAATGDPRRILHSERRRPLAAGTALLWIAIAVGAGVAFAAGRDLIAQPARQHRLVVFRPSRPVEVAPPIRPEQAATKPAPRETRRVTQRRSLRHTNPTTTRAQTRARHPLPTPESPPLETASVSAVTSQRASTVPSATSTEVGYARTASAESSRSFSSPSEPVGPAGPGYVIGSNCNPKCQ